MLLVWNSMRSMWVGAEGSRRGFLPPQLSQVYQKQLLSLTSGPKGLLTAAFGAILADCLILLGLSMRIVHYTVIASHKIKVIGVGRTGNSL